MSFPVATDGQIELHRAGALLKTTASQVSPVSDRAAPMIHLTSSKCTTVHASQANLMFS